jgi:hypothetical protein
MVDECSSLKLLLEGETGRLGSFYRFKEKVRMHTKQMMDLVRSSACTFTLLSGPASLNGTRAISYAVRARLGPFPN